MSDTIYDFEMTDNSGKPRKFAEFAGNVLLIVNTASKCGFTPQYKGLEELYKKYHDQGLVVLGFPCDQFGHQEPGSDEEIRSFCDLNYGVTFPLMKKIEVNGPGAHPVYEFLKGRVGGILGESIKWNFTKFLVSRSGAPIARFAPNTEPEAITSDIENALKAPADRS